MRGVKRRLGRRRCMDPRRSRRCTGCSPTAAHTARPILATARIRSACRQRDDFTGRGFGLTRLREAP